MLRRHAVQIGGRGEGSAPEVVVPAPASDPAAGREGAGPLGDALERSRERGGFGVHLHQRHAESAEVQVGVGEAGEDAAPAQVDGLGVGQGGARRRVRPDVEDAAVARGEPAGAGQLGPAGIDGAVQQQEFVGHGGLLTVSPRD